MGELKFPHKLRFIGYDYAGKFKNRPATPSEIAAAHPKCCDSDGTPLCAYAEYERIYTSVTAGCNDVMTCRFCGPIGPNDYCAHHTALTGGPDETE